MIGNRLNVRNVVNKFSIEFKCGNGDYFDMEGFYIWLKDKLDSELFVDHFRHLQIKVTYGKIIGDEYV